MGLESGTYVADLVTSNPVGGVDTKAQGDDHIRLIKTVLKNTFPNMTGAYNRVTVDGNASRTLVANDNGSLFVMTNAGAISMNTVAAASTFGAWRVSILAASNTVTFDPNSTELVNGASTYVIPAGCIGTLWCDGTGYRASIMPLAMANITIAQSQVTNLVTDLAAKIGATTTDTLQNKTINLSNNTLSGTLAQFNTACSDADFCSLAGSETLTNKTHTNPANTQQTLTDGATVNWDASAGGVAQVTYAGNRTMANPTNLKKATYVLIAIQDATGTRVPSWGANFLWGVDGAPTLSTGANKKDILSFWSDGTYMYFLGIKKGF